MTEREEALRLWRGAKTHLIRVPQNDDEFPDTMRLSVKELIELIRLSRAQPQGRPIAFSETESAACTLVQAHQPAQAVPEGFVLVPEEPTPAMFDEMHSHRDGKYDSMNFYRALLAAAPKPGGKDE